MTQLLISVTNIDEARIALENGVDVLDLKDPSDGALGALDIQEVNKITTYVNHKTLVSATIGNIKFHTSDDLDTASVRIRALVLAEVDIIKIGFFDNQVSENRLKNVQQLEISAKLLLAVQAMCLSKIVKFIAVLFAENSYETHFIDGLLTMGFEGLMIDTMVKNGQSAMLFNNHDQFKSIADRAHAKGCWFGVAGSLQPQDIALVKYLKPTYIGFRGAACDGNDRKNTLSPLSVQMLRKLM